MELTDLTKDVRYFLLKYWTKPELDSRLENPVYFFEQVVSPHIDFLRRSGESAPRLRLKRTPTGQLRVILNS
jgi:hypothetical protein